MSRPDWLEPPVLGVGDQIVVAGGWRTNALMIEDCARLYWPDPQPSPSCVLDATWGKGNFWTDRMIEAYHPTSNDVDPGIKTDYSYDFRDLPSYLADVFDVVLFDPDYTVKGTRVGHSFEDMNRSFGLVGSKTKPEAMLESNCAGLDELVRCTRAGGLVLVKYADQVDSGRHFDGCYRMTRHAVEKLGLVPLRRMIFSTKKARAQKARKVKGVTSVQRNAGQNTSELLIFRVPA